MAHFDQHNQTVTYQYNADLINFGAINSAADFSNAVAKLNSEVQRAQSLGAIPIAEANQTKIALDEAQLELKLPHPNKRRIKSLLEDAGRFISGAADAVTLFEAIKGAAEFASNLF